MRLAPVVVDTLGGRRDALALRVEPVERVRAAHRLTLRSIGDVDGAIAGGHARGTI